MHSHKDANCHLHLLVGVDRAGWLAVATFGIVQRMQRMARRFKSMSELVNPLSPPRMVRSTDDVLHSKVELLGASWCSVFLRHVAR